MKTILFCAVLLAYAYGLTPQERNAVTNAHNNFRSQLAKGQTPFPGGRKASPAKNMYKIAYNTSIEAVAQAWANRCEFKHSSGSGFGENLYMGSGKSNFASALTAASNDWCSEFEQFGDKGVLFQNGKADINWNNWSNIGHATQMAWSRTTQIGCGIQFCSNLFAQYGGTTIVVCNYAEPGNFRGRPIYEIGQACTSNSQCTQFTGSRCETSTGLCLK